MPRIRPFHSEVESASYNPLELWVFHHQDRCGYGFRVSRDGHARVGIGKAPSGCDRGLCALCEGLDRSEGLLD